MTLNRILVGLEPLGESLQNRIADAVAILVVDRGEIVDAHTQHRQLLIGDRSLVDGPLQIAAKQGAVRQTGEHVEL